MKNNQSLLDSLVSVLRRYMDVPEKFYKVVSLWIIGSYLHKQFSTYPYFYLNASKGSGKTRLLKLIAYFSNNGKVLALPSEAFIFRKAETMTFCLDELENITAKEKNELRLLLNTAYKRGLFVPRMRKNRNGEIESEEFETFAPIAIANIGELGDVLEDRCITMVLEKSHNKEITKKVEAWEFEGDCIKLKERLVKMVDFHTLSCFGVTGVEDLKYIPSIWNNVLENLKTCSSFDEAFANAKWVRFEPTDELLQFFRKLYEIGIEGRDLELWLPLFFVAHFFGILDEIISIATENSEQRQQEEIAENPDIILLSVLADFIKDRNPLDYARLADIKNAMVETIGEEQQLRDGTIIKVASPWLNEKWLGRALKRMNLYKSKKRIGSGRLVILDFDKIKQKLASLTTVTTQMTLTTLTTQTTQTTLTTQDDNNVVCDVSVVSDVNDDNVETEEG